MKPFGKEATERVVIIRNEKPLSEVELATAFNVSENTPWYRAMKQVIFESIDATQDSATGACQENNALAAASCVGAVYILKLLILEMEKVRKEGNKQNK